jgi:hypothetical protein
VIDQICLLSLGFVITGLDNMVNIDLRLKKKNMSIIPEVCFNQVLLY